MAENEEARQAQEAAETPDSESKKKKKPNFSKPFIISGILLGVFAGAPVLNLGNYIFGLWGWIFGLLAAWYLSKEYKYFLVAHGGMVGFFTGLIGSVIAMGIDIGLCFANISTFTLLPVLEKVRNIMGFWVPAKFHNAVILPTWTQLQEAMRIARTAGDQAVTPSKTLMGHAFFMVPLLAGTAILGGIIGYYLFAKEPPKKKIGLPRRRRPAEAEKPQVQDAVQSQDAGIAAGPQEETAASGDSDKETTEGDAASGSD